MCFGSAAYESSLNCCVEKFFRKLAGMADLEDALKRLDRLTQEEARMALSEVLKITHNTRDEVKVVDGKVEIVGNKVAGVGDKVEAFMKRSKLSLTVREAYPFIRYLLTSLLSEGNQARGEANEVKLLVQQTATVIDEVKCS